MAALRPLLGDGITDDTLLHFAHFLPTAKDLLSLGLTCPRFAAKASSSPLERVCWGTQTRRCCRSRRRQRGAGWSR